MQTILLFGGVVLAAVIVGLVLFGGLGGRAPLIGGLAASSAASPPPTPRPTLPALSIPSVAFPTFVLPTLEPIPTSTPYRISVNLTASGSFSTRIKATVPAAFLTFCQGPLNEEWGDATKFVATVFLNSKDFPRTKTWDLFFSDDDGPGHYASRMTFSYTHGYDKYDFVWEAGDPTFGSGRITYVSGNRGIRINVKLIDVFYGKKVTLKGTVVCK